MSLEENQELKDINYSVEKSDFELGKIQSSKNNNNIILRKNHEIYFDQLRAIAICGINSCHVCCDYFYKFEGHYKENITFYILSFFTLGNLIGIPIFLMLSGALLINKNYSLKQFFFRRFNRVFVPFLFWFLIYLLFSIYIYQRKLSKELIFNIFYGRKGSIGTVLWYVWMISVVYIAIFFINFIFKYGKSKYKNFENIFSHFLFIFCLIFYYLCNLGYLGRPGASRKKYYLFFVPYAILGYYLTHIDFVNLKIFKLLRITPLKIVIVSFLISIIGYINFTFIVIKNSLKKNKFISGSYFQFRVLIFTCNLILFMRYLYKCQEKFIEKIRKFLSTYYIGNLINSISKCSYGIYFIHYLILKYIQKFLYNRISFYNNPLFWDLILLNLIFFSSLLLILFLSKIPYVKKISGAN